MLDFDKLGKYRANLPADALKIAIPGGNHAQFGSYGLQEGDGEATIAPSAQLAATVEAILPALMGQQP